MALDISPDQCLLPVDEHGSSDCGISGNYLQDSPTASSGSLSSNNYLFSGGFTVSRRPSSVDIASLPRVHGIRRPNSGVGRKQSQPDLINNHAELSEHSQKPCDIEQDGDLSRPTPINHLATHPEDKLQFPTDPPSWTYCDLNGKCRLSAPGKSLVVNNEYQTFDSVPQPLPIVAADQLRPYSPSLITVVKEGPSHEVSPLKSSKNEPEERILKKFGGLEREIMTTGDQSCIGDIGMTPDCKCRVVLEDHLLSSISKSLELQNQMEETESKCARWENEAGLLRARVQELEMELGARAASLQGLKTRLAEKFVHCAEVEDQKRRLERDAKALQSELDSTKKNTQWYREKLHCSQVERSALEKELMGVRQEMEGQRREGERQVAEVRRLRVELQDITAKTLREKKSFTRHLETALAKQALPPGLGPPAPPTPPEDSHEVMELKQVVCDMQVSLKSSSTQLQIATSETERLLQRTLSLQQELCDTRVQLKLQQESRESAEVDRDMVRTNLKEREELLTQLSSENANLSLQLQLSQRERAEGDEAVKELNRNFSHLSNTWRTINAEKKALSEKLEIECEAARRLIDERDSLAKRVDAAERREQAAQRQISELQVTVSRAAKLEHEVLALKESLDRARTDAASLEAAQRSAVVLEQTAADLERRNEHLRGQVDGLSQLLQENTGSRIEDHHQLQQRARQDELHAENANLQEQVERSSSRVLELSKTIESLEAEMGVLQSEPKSLREEVARLAAELGEANARLGMQTSELQRLQEEKASLLRAKLELSERAEQLASWLQAMTDGAELGERYEARQRTMERLATTPVKVESVCVDDYPSGDGNLTGGGDTLFDQLQAFREANTELVKHADTIQRCLDAQLDPQQTRPDLLQSSAESEDDPSATRAGDLRCLQVLLKVCLHRMRAMGQDVQLPAPMEHSLSTAEVELERMLVALATLACHVDSALHAAGVGAGPICEPDMLQAGPQRPQRRDQLMRALLVLLEENTKARKDAEDRLTLLQAFPAGDGENGSLHARIASLEQELSAANANVKDLHKQLFAEKRECLQLRKEVNSLRIGLDTANDMLDNNKIALGRSESYGQVLMVSKEQVEARLEVEQRKHEECRARLDQLAAELHEARAKDPILEAQIKTLGCHLHQRTTEVRALQERLELRDKECIEVRTQLDRQRVAARTEYETLSTELQKARQDFSQMLCEMGDAMPKPQPCDEEGLSALIKQSNQLSPLVLEDLKTLLHSLKADLAAVDKEAGIFLETHCPAIQNV